MTLKNASKCPSGGRDLAGSASERVTVLQALDTIGTGEADYISLAVMRGTPTREVSEMLKHPHGTVSSKLHRSLIKLRKILE